MKRLSVMMFCFLISEFAFGFWSYLNQYQLGIEYAVSSDTVELDYTWQRQGTIDDSCMEDINDSTQQVCKVVLEAGGSSGLGLFIQQPFRRTGNLLLNLDLGFGVRYLTGAGDKEILENDNLPLDNIEFQLFGFLVKPYIQIGYTPLSGMPDVILTFGPVFQTSFGTVKINELSKNVAIATASGVAGYAELEIVFIRFGDGAFSIYGANDRSGDEATKFFPTEVDGMSNFVGKFYRNISGSAFGYGVKLVLNWP